MTQPNTQYHSMWSVRDFNDVVHLARVERQFDHNGELTQLHVVTGCCARGASWARPLGDHAHYGGTAYPSLVIQPGIVIVKWRVNEPPTCVACAAIGMFL